MKLEQFQKDDLKSLTEHRGFKILEELVKEMEYNLLKEFKTVNLADVNVGVELNGVQNKLAGAECLINLAVNCTKKAKEKSI